jgi:hypothetical protein
MLYYIILYVILYFIIFYFMLNYITLYIILLYIIYFIILNYINYIFYIVHLCRCAHYVRNRWSQDHDVTGLCHVVSHILKRGPFLVQVYYS